MVIGWFALIVSTGTHRVQSGEIRGPYPGASQFLGLPGIAGCIPPTEEPGSQPGEENHTCSVGLSTAGRVPGNVWPAPVRPQA